VSGLCIRWQGTCSGALAHIAAYNNVIQVKHILAFESTNTQRQLS